MYFFCGHWRESIVEYILCCVGACEPRPNRPSTLLELLSELLLPDPFRLFSRCAIADLKITAKWVNMRLLWTDDTKNRVGVMSIPGGRGCYERAVSGYLGLPLLQVAMPAEVDSYLCAPAGRLLFGI